MKLDGKVALVTGAGRGIGRAVALAFAREGASLALAARTESEIQGVAQEVRALGRRALAIRTDVSDEAEVNRMVARTIAEYGRIDILVNNAGIGGPVGPLAEVSLKDWQRTLDTNLTGEFLCAKAVISQMKEQGGGRIINVSSVLGKRPLPLFGAYSVTKAGIIALTQTLAKELSAYNISVNCLTLTVTDTELARTLHGEAARLTGETFEERWRRRGAEAPLGRVATPEDLVPMFLMLASEGSAPLSGEAIDVP
ncbi:MAG TPA: SDR family oxidoreductase [Dehalococcoidia bacterium]|jgi:NAD(P)-dependent dehydrogenase (short-subunit alcohol dehydrogenase family)|nr:SDR family oxidoreductase [Dehalococcoidia bacterium]